MISLINKQLDAAPIDLSVGSHRCVVSRATTNHLGWVVPGHSYITSAHVAALNALASNDARRVFLSTLVQVDIGEVNALGVYAPASLAARDAALEPYNPRKGKLGY